MKHEKHEKAKTILKDCAARGLPVDSAVSFLLGKGMSYEQILLALDEVTDGTLIKTALGEEIA